VLPHAIIALNASEHDINPKYWDVTANTESVLIDLARTVNHNETFKKYAQHWREVGKIIDTLGDLVLCYYSSIQVIILLHSQRVSRLTDSGDPNTSRW
jgi:hypothetical protein